MSQAAKKIKLDVDVSMDPFDEEILPFDVHQHILQYLSGSDLLKASEVSRQWNQKVERAKGFIEKVKLTIASVPPQEGVAPRSISHTVKDKLTRHDIAAVLNSRRNYVNVDIGFRLLRSFNLRQELLQKFACSIKYMACDVYIDAETPDISFPNLTQLEIIEPSLFVWRSFEILLPLMPAVETLRVDTLYSFDQVAIIRYSMSLKEVRCKRHAVQSWVRLSGLSLEPFNHNIRIIKE